MIVMITALLAGIIGAGSSAQEVYRVRVDLSEWEITMPDDLPAGPTAFEVTNNGLFTHSFRIEGQGLERQLGALLRPGASGVLEVNLDPGQYEVYCPVSNHAQLGMRRMVNVTERQEAPVRTPTHVSPTALAATPVRPNTVVTPIRPAAESDQTIWLMNGTPRTVSVSGTGQATAVPDQAVVTMGVRSEADTAAGTLAENSQRMQALLDVLRERGIEPEDIRTDSIRLFPRYDESPGLQPMRSATRTIVGYTVTNTVEVRVRNLGALGALLDQAVQAGVNTIDGIRFEIGEPVALLDQAREAAMRDASQKAARLADLADASVGDVLTIQEAAFGLFPPMAEAIAQVDVAPVPVEPGTQAVTVHVQVTWSLR
jgi:hypothetical protein